ncbi:MAG: hypothetical protein JO301_14605 [Chitinophagaceae bacterium]|nr:hypothetical protein [Chitinophagaceae bacterium]
MRKLFLIVTLFLSLVSQAQRKTVWGYLRDSITSAPIVLASITNLNTGRTAMTSNTGRFSIEISENHVLSFAAVGYHLDTIHFTNLHLLEDTLSLILSPLTHNLGNVTVRSSGFSRYQLDSLERRRDFLQDVGNYKIPAVAQANSGAGIALNLDRFSKREKAKRKAWSFFDDNEKEAYINYRFTPELVMRYTGLKDDRLQQFMQQYRPSWDWLRRNTDEEDMKYYINEKLKIYFKR